MAIKITFHPTTESLMGQSHWWGFPDLPLGMDYPGQLTFIAQIRLDEIAHLDPQGWLPHRGMLWFFAELDYFFGDLDAPCGGTGQWEEGLFKVLYQEDIAELHTHQLYWEDGSEAALPAEGIGFEITHDEDFGFKLLGSPAMTEGWEGENEGLVSLLQLDEEPRWKLNLFDSGTVNFMISVDRLKLRDFSKTNLCLHSL